MDFSLISKRKEFFLDSVIALRLALMPASRDLQELLSALSCSIYILFDYINSTS